jgi:hypothetical protein
MARAYGRIPNAYELWQDIVQAMEQLIDLAFVVNVVGF